MCHLDSQFQRIHPAFFSTMYLYFHISSDTRLNVIIILFYLCKLNIILLHGFLLRHLFISVPTSYHLNSLTSWTVPEHIMLLLAAGSFSTPTPKYLKVVLKPFHEQKSPGILLKCWLLASHFKISLPRDSITDDPWILF